jgi:tetratricopeptide (TPR) repeat protein
VIKTAEKPLLIVLLAACLVGGLSSVVLPKTGAQKGSQGTAVLSSQEVFERLAPSVFVVEVFDRSGALLATGSGVSVTSDEVLTNNHVIEDGVALRLRHGNETWAATVAYVDRDRDLCRLLGQGLNAPPVPIRPSSELVVGEHVYAIGAPEGLELSISEGLISGLRAFEQVHLVQTSAAISPGSSGGGLFDVYGHLIGITTFYLKEGQNLNFALPGEWAQAASLRHTNAAAQSNIRSPTFQVLSWFQLGNQMLQAGEYERAVTAFREVVRLDPSAGDAWYNLGFSYAKLAQYADSSVALQEAARLRPHDPEVLGNLAVAYTGLHRDQEAIELSKRAIGLRPDNARDSASDWIDLSISYVHLSRHDEAMQAAKEAIRLKPDFADALYILGALYAEQGDRNEVLRIYGQLKILDAKLGEKFLNKVVQPLNKIEQPSIKP